MFPDDLVERNRAFVAGRAPSPLPPVAGIPLAVVACYDPRLDSLLHPALGVPDGDAFLFRTAGSVVEPGSAILRSLALAVYLFDVRRVLVLGHTSCRMAAFPTTDFIESFRRRGVDRAAFGEGDIRTWAGAIASPRDGVRSAVATIVGAAVLPRDLEVAGAVLDDATGKIEVVVQPAEAPSVTPSPSPVELEAAAAREAPSPSPAPPPPAAQPALPGPVRPFVVPPAGALPPTVADHLRVVARAVEKATSKGGLLQEAAELRQELQNERHPVRQLALVQGFLRQAAAETQAARSALGQLHKEAQRGSVADLPRFLARLAGTSAADGGSR